MKKLLQIILLIISLLACQNSQSSKGDKSNNLLEKIISTNSLIILGGEKQYVEIQTKSLSNPVLLFIHGGPGWPQTPQLRYFNSELTNAFTLVIWEQRGSGISFQNDPEPPNMSLSQIISDAHELTLLLKENYKKGKIYLAGYSWGSIVGMKLALKYPDDYYAYIGISQFVNMRKGMQISQKWLESRAKEKSDTATLRILQRLQSGDTTLCKGDFNCFMTQYELLTKYNGAVFDNKIDKEMEKAMTVYQDYKDYDWNKAFNYSIKFLEKDMFAVDFSDIKECKIPIYFIQGRHDWNVPSELTESLFKNIIAPRKEIFWLEKSGHGPLEEEAEKFNDIMINRIIK
jgi:proline iminopeptidase